LRRFRPSISFPSRSLEAEKFSSWGFARSQVSAPHRNGAARSGNSLSRNGGINQFVLSLSPSPSPFSLISALTYLSLFPFLSSVASSRSAYSGPFQPLRSSSSNDRTSSFPRLRAEVTPPFSSLFFLFKPGLERWNVSVGCGWGSELIDQRTRNVVPRVHDRPSGFPLFLLSG